MRQYEPMTEKECIAVEKLFAEGLDVSAKDRQRYMAAFASEMTTMARYRVGRLCVCWAWFRVHVQVMTDGPMETLFSLLDEVSSAVIPHMEPEHVDHHKKYVNDVMEPFKGKSPESTLVQSILAAMQEALREAAESGPPSEEDYNNLLRQAKEEGSKEPEAGEEEEE